MLFAMSNLHIVDVSVQRSNDDTRPNYDTQIAAPNSDINVILDRYRFNYVFTWMSANKLTLNLLADNQVKTIPNINSRFV